MMTDSADKNSSLNIEENVSSAICYIPVLGILPAIAFLVIEKNPNVRWNAVQAIALWVVVIAADTLLGVSIVASRLVPFVNLIGLIVVPLVLAIKANQKEPTRMPILGEVTDKLIKAGKRG